MPGWKAFDLTANDGLPTTNQPVTLVNSMEFALVDASDNHVWTIEFSTLVSSSD